MPVWSVDRNQVGAPGRRSSSAQAGSLPADGRTTRSPDMACRHRADRGRRRAHRARAHRQRKLDPDRGRPAGLGRHERDPAAQLFHGRVEHPGGDIRRHTRTGSAPRRSGLEGRPALRAVRDHGDDAHLRVAAGAGSSSHRASPRSPTSRCTTSHRSWRSSGGSCSDRGRGSISGRSCGRSPGRRPTSPGA